MATPHGHPYLVSPLPRYHLCHSCTVHIGCGPTEYGILFIYQRLEMIDLLYGTVGGISVSQWRMLDLADLPSSRVAFPPITITISKQVWFWSSLSFLSFLSVHRRFKDWFCFQCYIHQVSCLCYLNCDTTITFRGLHEIGGPREPIKRRYNGGL